MPIVQAQTFLIQNVGDDVDEIELEKGSGGVFEITVDGEVNTRTPHLCAPLQRLYSHMSSR